MFATSKPAHALFLVFTFIFTLLLLPLSATALPAPQLGSLLSSTSTGTSLPAGEASGSGSPLAILTSLEAKLSNEELGGSAAPTSLLGRVYIRNSAANSGNQARGAEIPAAASNVILLRAADTGAVPAPDADVQLLKRAERFQLRMERARRLAADSDETSA